MCATFSTSCSCINISEAKVNRRHVSGAEMCACVWVHAHSSVGFYQNRFVSIIICYLYPQWNPNSCSLPHTHTAYYGGNLHGYKRTPWLCFCWNNCLLHNQHDSNRRAHWSQSGWGQIFSSLRRTVSQRHGDKLKTKQSWEVKRSILLTLVIEA